MFSKKTRLFVPFIIFAFIIIAQLNKNNNPNPNTPIQVPKNIPQLNAIHTGSIIHSPQIYLYQVLQSTYRTQLEITSLLLIPSS